jgi:hypothetical protein
MSPSGIQLVREYPPPLRGFGGERYVARAYTARQPGRRLWEAWLVFFSLRTGTVLATERETTQSARPHVLYWATGLGRTYLQGALQRALDRRPEVRLARHRARSERQRAFAVAEARMYTRAAAALLRAAGRLPRRRAALRRPAPAILVGRASREVASR